jgi:hypothetical protein
VLALAFEDGASAWAKFIESAEGAFASNQALAPVIGLLFLTTLVLVADWKFAGFIERAWRRRRSRGTAPVAGSRDRQARSRPSPR